MKNITLIIHPEELSRKWIDRIVTAGIPTLALHPVGGIKANESLEELIEKLQDEEFCGMIDYASKCGLKIEYEMHAARYLLPTKEFSAHPEWFRMNENGERTTDFNFCVSNEEALNYVAERAAELAKKLYRSTSRYYFWLDDGKDIGCRCPKCSKMSDSDQQILVLNKIIKRLKEDNKEAALAYLAYCSTASPPKKIKAEKGIFLEYAPFLRNFHRPIEEDTESENLSQLLEFFGKDGAKVLDYWYDNSLYSKWTKPPVKFEVDLPVLEADMDFYYNMGFRDIASFACYLGEDYEALYGEADISDIGALYQKYKLNTEG